MKDTYFHFNFLIFYTSVHFSGSSSCKSWKSQEGRKEPCSGFGTGPGNLNDTLEYLERLCSNSKDLQPCNRGKILSSKDEYCSGGDPWLAPEQGTDEQA